MDERVPPWYKEKRDLLIVGGIIGATIGLVMMYGFSNLIDISNKAINNQYYFPQGSWRQHFLYGTLLAYYLSLGLGPILIAYPLILLCVSYRHFWWWAILAALLLSLSFSIFITYELYMQYPITTTHRVFLEWTIEGTGVLFTLGLPYTGLLAGLIFWFRYNYKERKLRNERV